MMRELAALSFLLLLPGCLVTSAVGAAVDVAGTAVETAVDATTQTAEEEAQDRQRPNGRNASAGKRPRSVSVSR